MLINSNKENVTEHVKFISYTGKYPNLCCGDLTLEIDGEKVIFGSMYDNKINKRKGVYPIFGTPADILETMKPIQENGK